MTEETRRQLYVLPDGRLTTSGFVQVGSQIFRGSEGSDGSSAILWWDDDEAPGADWDPYMPVDERHIPMVWRKKIGVGEVTAIFDHQLWATLDGYRFEIFEYYPRDNTVWVHGGYPPRGPQDREMVSQIDLMNHPYVEKLEGGAYFAGEVPLEELSEFESRRRDLHR